MAKKLFGIILGILGIGLLVFVTLPIAKHLSSSKSNYPNLTSPAGDDLEIKGGVDKDYTKISSWFESDKEKNVFSDTSVNFYTLSIPSISIEDATVAIGGEDLSKYLIQYPGTSLPGKKGNSVIFGHSILPVFYDPKNYLAIFSTLPTIEKGSEIIVEYDGVTYTYLVETKFEVNPTDIQILEQNTDDSYLSLVTCTPPGDPRKPKRLIVRAKLSPVN